MKYYKDENNQIYAYEPDVSVDIVKKGLIAITEDEANAILNPPKSDEEIQAEIVARNTTTQTALTKEANTAISILQDAFDLDMQEDGDEERLK